MANADMRETGEPKQTWGGERRQNHLYKPFLRGALVTALTAGATLGALNLAVMGFGADLSAVWGPLIQAHGYAQMFGWVGLFIMGVAYHTLPRFYLRPLRRPRWVAEPGSEAVFRGPKHGAAPRRQRPCHRSGCP